MTARVWYSEGAVPAVMLTLLGKAHHMDHATVKELIIGAVPIVLAAGRLCSTPLPVPNVIPKAS